MDHLTNGMTAVSINPDLSPSPTQNPISPNIAGGAAALASQAHPLSPPTATPQPTSSPRPLADRRRPGLPFPPRRALVHRHYILSYTQRL
ncbi:unnamed protein product [Absidia cylindrospora]